MTLENAIMRHASGNLAPLLSALLLFLASPWIGFTGLAWIALAPILLYVTLAPLTISRVVAVLFSLFAYALSIAYPYMHVEGAWWAGVNGLSGLLTENAQYTSVMLFAAFIRALFFLPVVLLWRMALPRAYGPLLLSLLFAWAEWVFGALFLTGYSAGVIGYVLVDTPYLADLASLPTGVFTLSALVVYGNAFLAQALTRRRAQQGRWSSPRQVGEALMFLAIVAASFCYGLAYEHSKRWTEPPLTVAVIGTPLSTEETITESGYRSYRKELIAALDKAAAV
jgi:apolipoprotein N-acyltransferase